MSEKVQRETGPAELERAFRNVMILCALVGVLAAALLILAVWWLPAVEYYDVTANRTLSMGESLKIRADLRHSIIEIAQVIVTIVTAAAVVATLYMTSKNAKSAADMARTAEETAQQNLRMQRETQLGERFTRAVDQLSSRSCSVRVGAIATLAHVARESQEDHWPIVELLTAFLREQRRVGTIRRQAVALPPEDARAIANFLRTRHFKYEHSGQCIDLQLTNLDGLTFDGAHMVGADLSGAELGGGASFRNVDLTSARLITTVAVGSIFSEAHLNDATLNGANFTRADMKGADLKGASTTNATFDSFIGPIKNVTDDQRRSASVWREANGPAS